MSTQSDNPSSASSGTSPTGTNPANPVNPILSIATSELPLTLEQLRARHALELEAALDRERQRAEEEHAKIVARVNELPAFLNVKDLVEVEALIRMVRRGDKALPLIVVPSTLGTPIRRATSSKIIQARAAAGADMDREKALTAIRAGASAKEIKRDYGYSSAWFYREKNAMGLTKVYNRPTAAAKKRGAARFPAGKR